METKFNKEQVCELDEKALVNAFEVEELEKRYEMGWLKSNKGPEPYDIEKFNPDDITIIDNSASLVASEKVEIFSN
jgi:hypothetical protein